MPRTHLSQTVPAISLGELSPREREVLQMAAAGLTNAEIARRLAVTVHTVKFHLASIYRKLEVANRTEAAITFVRLRSGMAE